MQNQQGQPQPNVAANNAAASTVVDNATGESRAMKVLRRVQGVEVPPATPTPPVQNPPDPKPVVNNAPPATPSTPQPEDGSLNLDIPVDDKATPPVKSDEAIPVIDDDDIDNITDPKGENFMKFRKKLKATVSEKKELKEKLAAAEKRASDYESGLVAPEQIQTMQTRITELETFEQLHNFKSSPAYKTQFTEPLNAAKNKFETLAATYGVEPELVEQAVTLDDEKQINQLISRHFPDTLSQLEVKEVIKQIKTIRTQAAEAEKNPAAVAAELETRHLAAENHRRARKNEVIANTAKNQWVNSLLSARDSQEFPELSFIEGNTEHNEKIARPLLTRSAAEYSKIVKDITHAIHTGSPLAPDAMYAIANLVQRAYAATFAAAERERLNDELETLRGDSARNNAMDRPGANGLNIGGAGGAPVSAGREGGAKGAARRVLARVQGAQ